MNSESYIANIFLGNCGDLRYFYDENLYPKEQFQNDFLLWLNIRENGGLNKFLSPENDKKLSNAEKIRLKRKKAADIQGFHNFESILFISTSKFLAEYLSHYGITNLNDVQKEYLQNLLSGSNTYPLTYIGNSGKKMRISSDAVSLANLVAEDLLEKQTLHGKPRLVAKVFESYTSRGFIAEIFKNEVRDFFNKIPTGKTGFEKQLMTRAKEIIEKNYSENSKINEYINYKKYTFFGNDDGYSREKTHLEVIHDDLPNEIYLEQLNQIISIISKKATLPIPTMEKSTIKPEDSETKEEFEYKLQQLIQVGSRWKVFSAATLADILDEASQIVKFVRYSILDQAFKQALSVYQYVPQNSFELNSDSSSDSTEIEDLIMERKGLEYLTESGEFNLSGYCENSLFEKIEALKDENFISFEVFIEYLSKWKKLVQSNLSMGDVEEIQKELKIQMDLNDFKTANEIYQKFFRDCKQIELEISNTEAQEISYFSALLKYLSLNRKDLI